MNPKFQVMNFAEAPIVLRGLLLLSIVSLSAYGQAEELTPVEDLSRLMLSTFSTDDPNAKLLTAVGNKANTPDTHITVRNIALTGDNFVGTWLYSQRNTSTDNKISLQNIIELKAIDENTVTQVTYTPKDRRVWENLWEKPQVLSGLSQDDFEATLNEGCEKVWIRNGPNQWRAYIDPIVCKRFSVRHGRDISIEEDSQLSLGSLSLIEREFSLDGQPLGGADAEVIRTLLRRPSSSSELLEFSEPTDWRQPMLSNMVLMTLDSGDVWIELAPQFAPLHVENIKTLIAQRYFDNTAVIRSQDNYVVQWGDVDADTDGAKSLGKAKSTLPVEFFRTKKSLDTFTVLDGQDAYADQVGFVDGFPVASDGSKAWLAHCYGMVGVGRDAASDSGNGSSLYVVTGHSPRHLDRNVTLVGRVLSGMHHLSTLPRGTGALGFYENIGEYVNVQSMRIGSEPDPSKNATLPTQILRTDTSTFQKYVELRTYRNEDWFLEPTGKISLCNVAVPNRSN